MTGYTDIQDDVLEAVSEIELDTVPHYYSPIVRYGAIMSASVEDKGRLVFPYHAVEVAAKAVMDRTADYVEAGQQALEALGWKVTRPSSNGKLGKPRVNSRLGAVVDFDELLIVRDGERHVIRFCATVCVDNRGQLTNKAKLKQDAVDLICDDDGPACYLNGAKAPWLYSKIWVRTSCVKTGGVTADQLDHVGHAAFIKLAEELSEAVVVALEPVYIASLAVLSGRLSESINIDSFYRISNFSLSVSVIGFDELFDLADTRNYAWFEEGAMRPLPDFVRPAAKALTKMRTSHLSGKRSDVMLIPVDNSMMSRGLYWVHVTKERIRMIGLAGNPFDRASDHASEESDFSWRGSPSNMLGVIATTKIANKM